MSLAAGSPETPEKASRSAVAIAVNAAGDAGSKLIRGFGLVASGALASWAAASVMSVMIVEVRASLTERLTPRDAVEREKINCTLANHSCMLYCTARQRPLQSKVITQSAASSRSEKMNDIMMNLA